MEIVQRIKKLVEAKTNGNKKEFAAIIGIVHKCIGTENQISDR